MFTRKYQNLLLGVLILCLNLASTGKVSAQCACYECPFLLPDNTSTTFTTTVQVFNSSNNVLGVNNALEQVCLDIEHTWVGDLDITLTSPDGTSVILFADGSNDPSLGVGGTPGGAVGTSGNDFDMCFVAPSVAAAPNIFGSGASCMSTGYADPCNGANPPCYDGNWGTYNEGCQGGSGLDEFNNGTGAVSGTWTLTINDNFGLDDGILWDWYMVFSSPADSCAIQPPPVPAICGNTTQVNIPDAGSQVTSVINNTGSVGTMGNGTVIENVCILIDHNYIGDLDIYLQEPDGTQIELSTDNGSFSDDYGNLFTGSEVCFTPDAATSITNYIGGNIGNYAPEGDFTDFDGPANGNWTLIVQDDAGGIAGTLESWSILFSNGDCASGCTYNYQVSDVLCQGDSYLFGSNILTTGGTYFDTTAVAAGCDSVVELTLTEYSTAITTFDAFICTGDTVTVNGVDYFTAGIYYDTLQNVVNCDSVIKIGISTSPYEPFAGLYAGDYTDYYKLNPYTGAVLSNITSSAVNGGWVNAAFTIRETIARIYWITDALTLNSVNLISGSETSVATDIASLPFFWSLKYYNGHLYTLTTSGDDDKLLVRFDPATGNQDFSFSIEIDGTAGYNISMGSSPVVNPFTGMYYIPLMNNVMLEYNISAGTGSIITLSGALSTPGFIELLEINTYTGEMYALTNLSDVVQVTKTGPTTANVSLVKSLTTGTGYVNPASTFDSDFGLYIFQAQTGCGANPLVAVDVNTGTEYCSNPPGTVFAHLEQLNCAPNSMLRVAGESPGDGDGPPPAVQPVKKDRKFEVRTFPNPVGDWLHLRVSLPENGEIYWRIVDLSGSVVRESKVQGFDHWNTFKVPFDGIADGVYFFEVIYGGERFTEKLIRQ